MLIQCQEANLALSNSKCKMMQTKRIVLGHHVSFEGTKVDPTKIEVISHISIPSTPKEVRNFLGHVGYYRRFIENFTRIAAHLFKLLTKDADLVWNDDCQNSFQVLKDMSSTTPILRGPNWSLPFHICTDASDTAIGVVLGQREDHYPYAIYFVSNNLSPVDLNYTVPKNELLALFMPLANLDIT